MQLMPGTARDMGVYNAWDPAQNIEGGTKYLAYLQHQFSNPNHVIAAIMQVLVMSKIWYPHFVKPKIM